MQKAPSHTRKRHAFSLVEVLLASSIFGLFVTTMVGAFLYGQESTALAGNRARAILLAEEGMEAIRNIRDANFSNLTDGTHGLSTTGNQWALSGSQDTTDSFTRQTTIASIDSSRKTMTTTVTWQQNAQRTGTVTLTSRLNNWMEAIAGNWTSPLQAASLDLASTNNGTKIDVQGNYAYMVRTDGTVDFAVIDISTPTSPSLIGSLNLTGTPTNIMVSGSYAYVSSTTDNQELQIIDLTTPSAPTVVGTYNAPVSADAQGVFVSGTTVYMVRSSSAANEFLIINAATPSAPTLTGSLDLGATANEVNVVGNYAYIASSSNAQELQVVNITTAASPSLDGSLNLSGNTDAITVTAFGSTVVIGQGNTLYTVDVTTATAPTQVGSLNMNGTVNDVDVGMSNTTAFVATGASSSEFQTVDITTPASPISLGSVNMIGATTLHGIAYDETLDRAFGASATNTAECVVFAPQ